MHAYGHTLRRVGDLRLLALPGEDGRARYCVAEGLEPLVTCPTLGQALGVFEALREEAAAEAQRRRLAAGGVADLTAYRLRRPRRRRHRGSAPKGPRPSGAEEP